MRGNRSNGVIGAFTIGTLLCGMAGTVVQGEERRRDANSRVRERRVLQLKNDLIREELAMISTAIEEYSIDNKVYPSTRGEVTSTAELIRWLTPDYLDEVPTRDPFGGRYQYWSTGENYAIISPGRDGEFDIDYDSAFKETRPLVEDIVCRGAVDSNGVDVVWMDGAICQWQAPGMNGRVHR